MGKFGLYTRSRHNKHM